MDSALQHIQDKHIKQAKRPPLNHRNAAGHDDEVTGPFEDPRFCWVSAVQESGDAEICAWSGYAVIQDFIFSMNSILELCSDLSYHVARPQNPSIRNGVGPSLLPTSLTSAFCSILSNYITLAKHLSLINRAEHLANTKGGTDPIETFIGLETRRTKAVQQALDYLKKARLDIILLHTTRREVDCLRIQSVDIHLLAIAFIHSLHSFVLPGDQGQDIIRTYRKYLSVLRGRASRRPQRRVFLDIQGFQEELDALKVLTETQIKVAEEYVCLLYPGSFRVTNTARMEMYPAEYEVWTKLDKTLEDRWEELDRLSQQSRRLKDDVKQAIEILEEDHGKAIRVFTVVTLFFLPL